MFNNTTFERKTKGDALGTLADLISRLGYDEMKTFAAGCNADPDKVNEWAKARLRPIADLPQAANNNEVRPGSVLYAERPTGSDPTGGLAPTMQVPQQGQ